MAVGGAEERLDRAVARLALGDESSVENGTSSARVARSAFGSVVISSYDATPRAAHSQT